MSLSKRLKLYKDMIDSLKQAEGACSQLIHAAGNPMAFIILRETLNLTIEGCMKATPHNQLIAPRTVYV